MAKPPSGADIPASDARADITPAATPPRSQPEGQYSPDGKWWWNGTQWVPAPGVVASSTACMVCGATPAIQVTLRKVVALVVFGVTSRYRGVYCRDCGLAMFRKRMSETLLTGWWGFIHFFINVWVIANNLDARARLMRLGPPVRDPAARYLEPGRPVFLRAGFIVTAVAVLVLGTAGVISVTTPPKPFSAEDQADIGQCATQSGTDWTPVDCSGPHNGKVVSLTHDQNGCPSQDDTAKLPDGDYACIDTTK